MAISLIITKVETVDKDNYTWDLELSSNITLFDTKNYYVSGTAPFTRVTFSTVGSSDAVIPEGYTEIDKYVEWDFGDVFNIKNNKLLTQYNDIKGVCHTYISPGVYNAKCTLFQVYKKITDIPNTRWLDYKQTGVNQLQWLSASANSTSQYSRWLPATACFTGCSAWSIRNLSSDTYIWENLSFYGNIPTNWSKYYACNTDSVVVSATPVLRKDISVTIDEIKPQAYINTQIDSGVNQITATFSPSGCSVGSFPIEEIVWNFDDGNTTTVNRHDELSSKDYLYFNNVNPNDPKDPRNYNIKHVYSTNNIGEVYYPYLTVYSSNTYSSDSACDSIGPLKYTSSDGIDLLNIRVDNNKILFASKYRNSVFFNALNTNISNQETTETIFTKTPKYSIKRSNIYSNNKIQNNTRNYLNEIIENKIITSYDQSLSVDAYIQYLKERKTQLGLI